MLIVGILCANYIRTKLYLSISIFVFILILLLLYCIKFKKARLILIGLLIIGIGVGDFYLEKNRVDNHYPLSAGSVVCGTVKSVSKSYKGRTILIKDIKSNNDKVESNAYVYLDSDEILYDINVGDEIVFIAEKVEIPDLYLKELPNSYYIKNDIKYNITTTEVVATGKDKSLKFILDQKIKENLALGLDNDKTNLMYSALFGDSTVLNPMTSDSFSESGVAHLLAVSGLNVSLIAMVLIVVLKLFKCNKYVRFLITALFLIGYCYMCSWSATIVRSTLMAFVLFGAPLLFSQYDTLSSLSGIIILLIRPSDLFDVSFLLSFICVLGITLFYSQTTKVLNKIHFNNPISQTLAMSVITNISTLVVMIYFFEEVSFIGIISNILILPLFTLVFCVVFVASIVGLIVPSICYLLTIISPIINIVIILSNYFASLAVKFMTIPVSYLSIIIYAILLFFISRYNVKGIVTKSLSVNVIIVLLITNNP